MDDEEIEKTIIELRNLLDDHGFGWAREQAEATFDPGWNRRWLAHALIDAAETVTVDLAEAETVMLDLFGTDEVSFKHDEDADSEMAAFVVDGSDAVDGKGDRLRGPQRREALKDLIGKRYAFQMLKARLDGLV